MQRHSSTNSLLRSTAPQESRYELFEPRSVEVPVRIRSFDRDEKLTSLHINTYLTTIGGTHHQSLNIEITDDTDPFFFYALHCGESEFHALKQEQAIIVDFFAFPHKLLELLEMCNSHFEDSPKFLCVLERNSSIDACLNIVETNLFKQLTHLSLKFKSGGDEALKRYLAAKLKESKTLCDELTSKLKNTEDSLQLRTAEMQEANRQLYRLQNESERVLEEKRLEEHRKMNNLKETMLEAQAKERVYYEAEKKTITEKYEDQLKMLTSKLEIQLNQIKDLSEARYVLEGKEREFTTKNRQMEHELELANNELFQLRGANKSLDSTKYVQEKSLTELNFKVQSYEKQLLDKEELNKKLTALIDTHNEQKLAQEETITMLKASIAKLEDKLHLSAQEINKGNSIIQKLQSELKTGKQKLKLKNSVVLQQHNLIEQKQEQIDNLEREIGNLKREIERKEDNVRTLEHTIGELRAKLEESQKSLQSNSQTIQWLNSRLNEVEKTRIPYTPSYRPQSASSISTPIPSIPAMPSVSSIPSVSSMPISTPNTSTFKPSTYSLDHLKNTPTRPPLANTSNMHSRSSTPEGERLIKFTEPIKYREPNV